MAVSQGEIIMDGDAVVIQPGQLEGSLTRIEINNIDVAGTYFTATINKKIYIGNTILDPNNITSFSRIVTSTTINLNTLEASYTAYGNKNNLSSLKYKTDIKLYAKHNELLYKLKPITFNYKYNKQLHSGLLYEHTINIMPQICSKQVKTINYSALIPYLINEIQLLSDELLNIGE